MRLMKVRCLRYADVAVALAASSNSEPCPVIGDIEIREIAYFSPSWTVVSGDRGRRFRGTWTLFQADRGRRFRPERGRLAEGASDLDRGHAGRLCRPAMPTTRITMRQIRQALRLHLEAGLSYAQVGRAVGIGKGTVGKFLLLARAAGVDWAVAQTLSDDELEERLYRPAVPRASRQLEPDCAWIHQELKRPGVTLQLLWEEYQRGRRAAYKYTSFCIKYRAWALGLKRSMRQTHIAGERLFVDYAGQTVGLIDAASGEIRRAQIFVAVLGASNYTFACATATQTAGDWVGAIIDALEFIGGVPRLIVPDQTRALIARPTATSPRSTAWSRSSATTTTSRSCRRGQAHPRDKPKVEVGVQVVERWILARLRDRRFFSLGELNGAISELLLDLNARAFKKLPGCRASAFEVLDRPALRALPASRMPIARFKRARVNIDYHVELDGHYYSVPHRLVRAEVELRITAAPWRSSPASNASLRTP
jgi:transposase